MTKRIRIIGAASGFGAQDCDSHCVTADLISDLIAEILPGVNG